MDDGSVGINQNNPGAKLDVNGTFKLTDGTQAAGAVLTSDANGLARWDTTANRKIAFSAYQNSAITFVNGTRLTIPFAAVSYNLASGFNNTTGIFTAPAAGIYHFDVYWGATANPAFSGAVMYLYLSMNSNDIRSMTQDVTSGTYLSREAVGCDLRLSAGDQVKVEGFLTAAGSNTLTLGSNSSPNFNFTFNGHRVY